MIKKLIFVTIGINIIDRKKAFLICVIIEEKIKVNVKGGR